MSKRPPPEENQNRKNQSLRNIPALGDLVKAEWFLRLASRMPRGLVITATRRVLQNLRQSISKDPAAGDAVNRYLKELPQQVEYLIEHLTASSLKKVINGTGVLLHTNLGRAPLSARALRHVSRTASGYCNLEYSLEDGRRDRRDAHIEEPLLTLLSLRMDLPLEVLSQSYKAIVVNNCAAATFLVLNSLAEGGDVLVSRGELIEIGGGFRIPEILEKSGAVLKEVGTTNRTRASDYASNVNEQTKMILRVHQANFAMKGFVERPLLGELVGISRGRNLLLFEDQGTGCVVTLNEFGLQEESTVIQSMKTGVDILTASGDKLFGGPQAGLIIGKPELIALIARNPLMRAFRCDKMTYAALQGTLRDYLSNRLNDIPLFRMLGASPDSIRVRAEALAAELKSTSFDVTVKVTESIVGGGTTPTATLPSYGVFLKHSMMPPDALADSLRSLHPPVISRIIDEVVSLDMRTIPPEEDRNLAESIKAAFNVDLPSTGSRVDTNFTGERTI